MAYNMSMNMGLYPDETGYKEWKVSNFPNEMGIEGTLTKEFKYIHPQDFHSKFLKNALCTIETPTYTDIKIRNDIEMTNNKRYFQPKEWNLNKLLYNYNCLWHIGHKEQKYFEKFIVLLNLHIQGLYKEHKVNIKQRIIKPSGELYEKDKENI